MDDWWVNRGLIPGTIGISLYHSIRSEAGGATHSRTQWVQGALSSAIQMLGCEDATNVQCRGCDYVFMASFRAEHKGNFAFLTEEMKQEQSDRKQHHSAVHSCRLANCYRLSSDVSGAASQFWFSTPTCRYDKGDRQLKNINHSLA